MRVNLNIASIAALVIAVAVWFSRRWFDAPDARAIIAEISWSLVALSIALVIVNELRATADKLRRDGPAWFSRFIRALGEVFLNVFIEIIIRLVIAIIMSLFE